MKSIVLERLPRHGIELLYELCYRPGVHPDLHLGVRVKSKLQEVKQIVEVHLPISLFVRAEWKVLPGLLPRNAKGKALFIEFPGVMMKSFLSGREIFTRAWVARCFPQMP